MCIQNESSKRRLSRKFGKDTNTTKGPKSNRTVVSSIFLTKRVDDCRRLRGPKRRDFMISFLTILSLFVTHDETNERRLRDAGNKIIHLFCLFLSKLPIKVTLVCFSSRKHVMNKMRGYKVKMVFKDRSIMN